jgi:two-component system sensor histidine kinase HydH
MTTEIKNNKSWTRIPPWVLIGAVAVLLPIFTFMTIENINRQKEKSIHLLLEKGAALIRSFEAGTRTGMMGMHRGGFQLQGLLTETARLPDIVHILVANITGEIVAHNNLDLVGASYDHNLDLKEISQTKTLQWRILDYPDGTKLFEVFGKFSPTDRPRRKMRGPGRKSHRMPPHSQDRRRFPKSLSDISRVIFVGLDMTAIEDAHKADIRHAVIMGIILLLVGFAGIMLLFILQNYRTTKASLSRIKAFSDNVVENMPIGLIALDDHQRIAAFNNTAESVLEISFQDVIGKKADKILPPEFCAELNCHEIQDPFIEKEINCSVSEGKKVPLEIGVSLLQDENNTRLGHIILFKDMTEFRALRREIETSRRLASVGRLAAGVAHEIRNPLSSIKGFATYFKERYQAMPEDQQNADIMIQEVNRLNRVVSQLLEFSRPVTVSHERTSLKDLLDDSLKLIERQAKEKKINVHMPNSDETRDVFIDADRIKQVLLNLYLNAIEAMPTGGELRVDFSEYGESGGLEIQISDSGQGIENKDLPKIFDPYYSTKSSGTGLGLAIAYNIIEAMGGKIGVKSQPDQGTTFFIIIPNTDRPKGTNPK